MTSWQEQYLAALQVRDTREQANRDIYNAYTKLADHTSKLTTQLSSPPIQTPSTPTTFTAARPSSETELNSLSTLRADLATAQSTRTTLTSEVITLTTTLVSLQSTLTSTSSTANSLAREKAVLERKLRDRDEELKEKGRMLERVQDEVAALEMQVNLLEEEKEGAWDKRGVRRGSAGKR